MGIKMNRNIFSDFSNIRFNQLQLHKRIIESLLQQRKSYISHPNDVCVAIYPLLGLTK